MNDGNYTFGGGTRYIGVVLAELVKPLGMTNKAAGGGSALAASGNGQVGVTSGTGLNNIGLLVRTTGLASGGSSTGFVLNDGSGVDITVSLASGGTSYDGHYVTVTGISCIDASGDRIIKARSAADVQIVK